MVRPTLLKNLIYLYMLTLLSVSAKAQMMPPWGPQNGGFPGGWNQQQSINQRVQSVYIDGEDAWQNLEAALDILTAISEDNPCDNRGSSPRFLVDAIGAHLRTVALISMAYPENTSETISTMNDYIQNTSICPADRAFAFKTLEIIPENYQDGYSPSAKINYQNLEPDVRNIVPTMPPPMIF